MHHHFLYIQSGLASGGINSGAIITALTGLAGVLVGGFIAYYFNKKLFDTGNKSRIAIQRKNLIFSKLYKELLIINKLLSELPELNATFDLETPVVIAGETRGYGRFFVQGQHYDSPKYEVWYEMKLDIRKTQVPFELREQLDALEKSTIEYLAAQDNFKEEIKKIEKEESKKMIEAYQQEPRHKDSSFRINFSGMECHSPDIEKIIEQNNNAHKLSEEVLLEMRPILEKVRALKSREELVGKFGLFKVEVRITITKLETIIQRIVDTYEYGDTLF